jgi:hypothetical protein
MAAEATGAEQLLAHGPIRFRGLCNSPLHPRMCMPAQQAATKTAARNMCLPSRLCGYRPRVLRQQLSMPCRPLAIAVKHYRGYERLVLACQCNSCGLPSQRQ